MCQAVPRAKREAYFRKLKKKIVCLKCRFGSEREREMEHVDQFIRFRYEQIIVSA